MEIKRLIVGMVQTNCYIAVHPETKEAVIVDPGDEAARIEDALAQTGAKAKAILLTHGHFDHIMAVEDVRARYQIPVYACREEEEMLLDPSVNMTIYRKSCSLEADVLLDDGQIFEVAGFSIQMFHTPGHTKGSCCYYIEEEGVLFSGDTLFHGSVGRTDFPGGSSARIIKSLHRLLEVLPESTEVFPGHDTSTTIGYEKRYNPFV